MQRDVLPIQRLVRGAITRLDYKTNIETQSLLSELENGLKFLKSRAKAVKTKSKPPMWQKSKGPDYSKPAVTIQRHIRGYLQRKAYRSQLIEKMLQEQEEMFQDQLRQVEDAYRHETQLANRENLVPELENLSRLSSYDMPRAISSNRVGMFSPSKNKILAKQVHYDYDIYILAAREIQRVWRGYRSRKQQGGSLNRIRRKAILIQRRFRVWRKSKSGQVELALELIAKQTEMLARTFTSYQQLRSLVLIKDSTGRYSHFLASCEDKLRSIGVYEPTAHTEQLKKAMLDERIQHRLECNSLKRKAQHWKDQHKRTLNSYLKGVKGLKAQLELAQMSNFEQVSSMVLELARAKKQLGEDSL
jgi:hypothetical protein